MSENYVRSAASLAAAVLALSVFACPACGSSSQNQGPQGDASTGEGGADAAEGGRASDAAGDGGAGDSAADGGLSPGLLTFCQKYATALCNDRQACAFPGLPPLADCTASEQTACAEQLLGIGGAMSSGRVVFDASSVDTCLSDAAQSFCDTNHLGSGVASCRAVFKGTVMPGGTCYAPNFILLASGDELECADGRCSATYVSCPGQCVKNLQRGAACSTSSMAPPSCEPTDYCDGAHCAAYLAQGAACDGTALKCDSSLVCGPHDADGALTCEAKKGQGQGCTSDSECERLNCLTGTCRTGHLGETCAAYLKCDAGLKCGATGCQQPLGLGAACSASYDACADGTVCELSVNDAGLPAGACSAFESRTAGQPCFNGQCAAGLWCQSSGVQGVCRAPGSAGQACQGGTAGSCATGLVCDGTTQLCQTPSMSGGPCDPMWLGTCATGFGCGPNMTCEAKVVAGHACDGSGACPDGYYCDVTCKAAKLPGTTCSGKDGECIGGMCDPATKKCSGNCVDPG